MAQQNHFMGPWLISILGIFPFPEKNLVFLLEDMSLNASVQGLPGVSAFLQSWFFTDSPTWHPTVQKPPQIQPGVFCHLPQLPPHLLALPWVAEQQEWRRRWGLCFRGIFSNTAQNWNNTSSNPVFSPIFTLLFRSPALSPSKSCGSHHAGQRSSAQLFLPLKLWLWSASTHLLCSLCCSYCFQISHPLGPPGLVFF